VFPEPCKPLTSTRSKFKMSSSTSYRTWIGFNDNSEGGITVYSVACYLSQGLQVDVFAFKHDAYLISLTKPKA
jgi:hypothetical protein